ncbi:hypothetical protein E2C01_090038 [Portunus trituberculatus]|uniref:Uncharacterized protein n=1 Tax=Portunus trituberculatus TaxID=210409 RepID=A0A5B7JDM8_PORTR|nr:hypothetical protein [Portunus trituberculatus]
MATSSLEIAFTLLQYRQGIYHYHTHTFTCSPAAPKAGQTSTPRSTVKASATKTRGTPKATPAKAASPKTTPKATVPAKATPKMGRRAARK